MSRSRRTPHPDSSTIWTLAPEAKNRISVLGLSGCKLHEWEFEPEAAISALNYQAAKEYYAAPMQFTFFVVIDDEQIPLVADVWSTRATVSMRDVIGSSEGQVVMVRHSPHIAC